MRTRLDAPLPDNVIPSEAVGQPFLAVRGGIVEAGLQPGQQAKRALFTLGPAKASSSRHPSSSTWTRQSCHPKCSLGDAKRSCGPKRTLSSRAQPRDPLFARYVQFLTLSSRTQSSPSANGGEGSAFRCRFVQFLTFVIPNPVAPFANVWRWARVRKDRPSRS